MQRPAKIHLTIVLSQGSFTLDFTAELGDGVSALFGPSGAGKTTVLDAIAGLRLPARGRIAVGDRVLFDSSAGVNVAPYLRRIGYVPQDIALFPHLNVRRNLLYGRHPGRSPDLDRVLRMLEIETLLDRSVRDLSGGERQRVALGRALMSGPSLLLLDEPLAAVDLPLRRRILPYLDRIRHDLGVPILYVSHDRDEVQQFAEHVVRLEAGRVVAAGTPSSAL